MSQLTIGLTGGVASGKSLAAKYFAELGAVVFDADRAGHEVLLDPQVRDELVERWGSKVLTSAGEVDRAAVARRVFGSSPTEVAERQFLEELLHPLIRERLEVELSRHSAQGKQVFVLDAALLLEAGWDWSCDEVIFVDAPRELRQSRAAARGWSAEQFADREAAQWPIEKKRALSDWVFANAGSPEELRARIHEFWETQVAPNFLADSP